jgi:uncharacterized membrane protein YjgN (DUF898 family)
MTTVDAAAPAAPAGLAAPAGPAAVRFLGDAGFFWRLLTRGAVLLMLTLGIYRFWLTTDIRRFLWSNTELSGETFEYSGTAREILLGFLIAIAILAPFNAVFVLVALVMLDGLTTLLLSVVLLTVLSHYAVYRARSYRLTRTVYRGIRFHQAGSAWLYAIYALFWWTLVVLTLGLAYPFAQSQLERFKLRNTFFGDLPGRFEGSGLQLFVRGVLIWFLAVVPTTAGALAAIGAIDWEALSATDRSDDALGQLIVTLGFANATAYALVTLAWVLLSLLVLYPIFQAMMLRWWVSGLRFGGVVVTSRLRTAQIFGVYARFLGYALLFSLPVSVLAAAALYAFPTVMEREDHSILSELVVTMALVAAYVIAALGYFAIHQATVGLGLWRCVTETVELAGGEALAHVSAAGEPGSPVGEGLADALNVGGTLPA